MIENVPTYILIMVPIIIVVLTLVFFKKLANNENKKMLEDQDFALANPDKIEKVKLVDHREVFCVVTLKGKSPVIIANGVQAVRVFDKLILAKPELAE